MRAYCACLGVPHFHWLTFAHNLAMSSTTARLCASIEFTVIPKRAQYERISNKYGPHNHTVVVVGEIER
jgi:hypothetical protein